MAWVAAVLLLSSAGAGALWERGPTTQPLHDLGGGGSEGGGGLCALLEDVACHGWSPLIHLHDAPRARVRVLQALWSRVCLVENKEA